MRGMPTRRRESLDVSFALVRLETKTRPTETGWVVAPGTRPRPPRAPAGREGFSDPMWWFFPLPYGRGSCWRWLA